MKITLAFVFWLCVVGAVLKLLFLSFLDYPRTHKYQRWEDALQILCNAGCCVWIAHLLWGIP